MSIRQSFANESDTRASVLRSEAAALLERFEAVALDQLFTRAWTLREQGHDHTFSYSRKAFIPVCTENLSSHIVMMKAAENRA